MILPGAIQATTGIILSYPFDTIKSNMQKNPHKFSSSYDCFYRTIKYRGISGLYRGLPAPLVIMMIKRGIQYDLYEKLNNKKVNTYINGAFTGILGSTIGCPMHYVKINLQINNKYNKINNKYNKINNKINNNKYNSTINFVKTTYKEKGIKEFYRGIKADCLKECTFGCVYLGTYGLLREKLPQNHYGFFLSGGLSSVITWTLLFPIDSLRTNIMSNKSDNGIVSNFKIMKKNKSIIKLWTGLPIVLIRIFPVSAISMVTYEYSRKLLEKD